MVVGTIEGGLMVWTRYNGSHGWLPQCTRISTEVSIISLSFRNDGSLLAVGATMSLIPSIKPSYNCTNPKGLIDKIQLYETSNWTCVRSLNLNSRVGFCDFLKSNNMILNQNNYKEINLKINSNIFRNFLLVFTNDGPQVHFIPEFNVIINEDSFKQNVLKTVRWADSSEKNNMYEFIKEILYYFMIY